MAGRIGGRALASALGTLGAWSFALQEHPAEEERAAVGALEAAGYGAIWFPESVGSKEALSHAAILLGGGRRIVIASGVANIWARDPMAAANGARTLGEAWPGRFLLGLGVSHAPSVAVRGQHYDHPLERMRTYLEAMDAARYSGPEPAVPVGRVLAALGPRMLELAAERADGAHTYFVPVEHTAQARARLGPEPFLAVEQTAVLEPDPVEARRIARAFAGRYLELANYANNLRRLGYGEDDLADGGSDRVIDAVVAWGDAKAIAERVRAHLAAGADHVCIQLRASVPSDLCLGQYRELAAELLGQRP